jgi:raffinose/stachyose/melibiose transport system substrate-binding protein
MKKNLIVTLTVVACVTALAVVMGGCAKKTAQNDGSIVLNYPHYWVGAHLNKPVWDSIYKRFNEKNAGKITIKIEELPSDQSYTEKMRVLAASKELPDVIDGKDGLKALAIANRQAVDLRPFLDRDPDFRDKVIGPAALAANTEPDGKIYSVTAGTQVIGYYYNKEMFAKAGIQPARTWDEWFSNCEKLKATGVYPLALMTGENSWTTNLILSAMIASRGEAGQAFMNTKFPTTYQTPEVIAGLADIQKCLQQYTTPDALGAMYANAANNFLIEQAAIISNGPWMIGDFANREKTDAGFENKVGWSMFPGEGLVTSNAEGYLLCSPPERQEAGWALLVALNDRDRQLDELHLTGALPTAVDLEIPADVRQKTPLVAEHADAVGKMKDPGDTFSVISQASVVDAFARYYPELAAGTLSPAQMAVRLDEAAARAQ